MSPGIRVTDKPSVATVTEVLGIRRSPTDVVAPISIAQLSAQIEATSGPTYGTRAELFADLAWDAGAIAKIVGDPNPLLNGVYKKNGASGAGSWTRIGPLPEADNEALAAEIVDARQGEATLEENIAAIKTGKLDNSTDTNRILGRKTAGTGAVEQIAPVRGLSIDVDGLGLADMPEATIRGRAAGAGTGTPTSLTPAQARAAINAIENSAPTGTFLGRKTAGTGAVEQLSKSDALTQLSLEKINVRGADIASASTINLDTATGDLVRLTGSTAINAVTLAEGVERYVVVTDTLTINVGASLIGDNDGFPVTVEPGDGLLFRGDAGGVVRFWRSRAKPIASDSATDPVVIAGDADPFGNSTWVITRLPDGGFRLIAEAGVVQSPIESATDPVVAWAAAMNAFGETPIAVMHDGSVVTSGLIITPDALPAYDPQMLPYFPADLCGIEGEEVTLYAENLIAGRADGSRIRVFAHGNDLSAYQRQGREQVVIRPDQMIDYPASATGTGKIGVRAVHDKWLRFGEKQVNIRVAEKTPTPFTLNVLNFGDSTLNLGFMSWLKHWCAKWGYPVPLGIGTLAGVADAGDVGSGTTRLGEPKPGHWFADFTYRNTDRVGPLPIGDEATYAGLTTDARRLFNTMLRSSALAAVDGGAVNPADVRNGYYLDFQFYVARHGLATPTMLVFNPCTNDLTHLTSDVYTRIYEDMMTVARRWKAAYPSAPIVYFLPPTGDSADRVALWSTNYEQARRAIVKAEADIRALGIDFTAVLTCSMVSTSADYDVIAYDETPDADLGSVVRAMDDGVHVTGAGRASMFKHAAYAICCAATGV